MCSDAQSSDALSAAAQPSHVLSAAQIAHLAHAALGEVPPADPLVLLVQEDDEGVSFLSPPPPSGSLLDQLAGLDAPPEVGAVAVAATGRAWALDPRPGAAPIDVAVGFALLRSGSSATYVTGPDGPLELDDVGVGRIPDLCHRALGLPTPRPEVETDVYLNRTWLDALVARGAARPGQLTWPEAVLLHPVGVAGVMAHTTGPVLLAAETRTFATVVPWPLLRRRFSQTPPDQAVGRVPSGDLAAWLDDGSFSRWVLDPLPSPEEAWPILADLVPEAVLRDVQATIAITEELGQPLDGLWEDEVWDDDEDSDPRLDGWVNPCS